jgi:hypothetical protein
LINYIDQVYIYVCMYVCVCSDKVICDWITIDLMIHRSMWPSFLALKICMRFGNNWLCCNCNQDGIMDGDIDQSTLELALQVWKF